MRAHPLMFSLSAKRLVEDDQCYLKLEAPVIALCRANRIKQLLRNKQALILCDFELRNGLSSFNQLRDKLGARAHPRQPSRESSCSVL
jgi:hypothetical protein